MAGLFPSLAEIRSSVATPEKWLVNWINGGVETAAGVSVDEGTALNFAAFFNGVNILAGALMQAPLHVLQKMPEGGRRKAKEHPLYPILHENVNARLTSARWRQTGMGHLATWGNHYAIKIFNRGNGALEGIVPLMPDRIKLQTIDGKLVYSYRPKSGGAEIKYTRDQILHIPGFGYDGVQGYSLVSLARESIGLGLATQQFMSLFYGQGTNPGTIFKHPRALTDKVYDRLKSELTDKREGLGKSHKAIILEDGMEIQPWIMPLKDAETLASRKYSTVEIAQWLNIPVHKLKDLDRATNNNIEQQALEFHTDSMGPWYVIFETELGLQLLREDERAAGYYIKFDLNGLLRGDYKTRQEGYAIGRQWGWLCPDDILEREDMDPLPDGQGKIYLVPLNMVPANQLGGAKDGAAAATVKERLNNQYGALLESIAGRIASREEKILAGKEPDKRDEYLKELPPYLRAQYHPIVDSICALRPEQSDSRQERMLDLIADDYLARAKAGPVNQYSLVKRQLEILFEGLID